MRLRSAMHGLLVVAVLLASVWRPTPGDALTTPETYDRLTAFRDAMAPKSKNWAQALSSWRCPTKASNSDQPCDPCGRRQDGNWLHMHCRGNTRGWGESGDGTVNGVITNMHITDVQVDGPFPRELCLFPTLREVDMDGGHLSGPIPEFLKDCFPVAEELDLSYNRFSGTLPRWLAQMTTLSEVKLEDNDLTGTIPPEVATLPRLRRFQIYVNQFTGRIPDTFKARNKTLTQFMIADNDIEGDLSAVAGSHLLITNVHNNPRLCGMVPASVRWAKGYNPSGTRLGQPC